MLASHAGLALPWLHVDCRTGLWRHNHHHSADEADPLPPFAAAAPDAQACTYMLDVALHSHSSLHMSASQLAAAAVWLVKGTDLAASPGGEARFEEVTGASVEELRPCLRHVAALFVDAQRQPHLYVHRKHAALHAYMRTHPLLDALA